MLHSIPTTLLGTLWDGEAVGGTAQCPSPCRDLLEGLGLRSSSADYYPKPDPGLPWSTLTRRGQFPCL